MAKEVMRYTEWYSINEKMGVPSGIEDAAYRIYNETISDLKKESTIQYIQSDIESRTNVSYVIRIKDISFGDESLDIVKHTINLHNYTNIKPTVASLGIQNNYSPISNDRFNLKNVRSESYSIQTNIVLDFSKYTFEDALRLLTDEYKSKYISSIAHELMHAYDHLKSKKTGIKSRVEYFVASDFKSGINQIDDFFHLLYYMTAIESAVRPSQVITRLKKDGVTKSSFMQAIKDDDTWQTLQNAKNFSVNDLISRISNDDKSISKIKEIFDLIDAWNLVEGDKEDPTALAKAALKLVYINIVNLSAKEVERHVTSAIQYDPFMAILGMGDIERAGNKIMDDISKYKNNYIEYYKNIERHFNREANKVMRKIIKLYDMVPDDKNLSDKSIIHRDLHQKITGKTNSITDTKIKESLSFTEFLKNDKK